MTEHEFLTCTYPLQMLTWLQSRAEPPSDRKMRLWVYACSCLIGLPLPEWENGEGNESEEQVFNVALSWAVSAYPGDDVARRAEILKQVIGNPWRPELIECAGHIGRAITTTNDGLVLAFAPWFRLTPQVRQLAEAAYNERVEVKCARCKGRKYIRRRISDPFDGYGRHTITEDCPNCHSVGSDGAGQLDPGKLAALSDALEDANCTDAELLMALRGKDRCAQCKSGRVEYKSQGEYGWETLERDCCDCLGTGWIDAGPRYRGFWALDLILGKE